MSETQTLDGTREQAYFDIFSTALEGGIGYWSRCKTYHWTNDQGMTEDLAGYHAEIYDVERIIEEGPLPTGAIGSGRLQDERYALYRIERAIIAKGIEAFASMYGKPDHDTYFGRAARHLAQERWDHLDYDATIADAIVQMGLFGEVVYA